MAAEMSFTGKAWKFGDAISTDLMMPGSQVLARRLSEEEGAKYCFSANRPGWTDQVSPGDIIVAGKNFGCGSSRNGARVIQLNGIAAILAESTSRIFLRNAINVALPTLWCEGVGDAFQEGERGPGGPDHRAGQEHDQRGHAAGRAMARGQSAHADLAGRWAHTLHSADDGGPGNGPGKLGL